MVSNIPRYNKQIHFCLSTDDPNDLELHNGDLFFLMDVDKLMMYDEASVSFKEISLAGGGGGGGASIQAPYIVASGSVVPTSNTDHLQIDISASGMSAMLYQYIMIDDYENYAQYTDIAPVVLRQVSNSPNAIPEFNYGAKANSNVALKSDGTLASGTNGNNAYFSGGIVHFGFYWSGYTFKAGVTYNFIVVGV